jgi:WD40 repeat protein
VDAENTDDPVRTFAERLRRLQRDAGGPSVRDLVRLTAQAGAPYTRGTLQDKLAGRTAPTWEFVASFVRACALHTGAAGDPDLRQWRDWHVLMTRELADRRAGRRRAVPTDLCPYRGLEAFATEHSHLFHGRAAAVQEILAGLTTYRRGLVILGPSGAGKTSLVQAGVLPALAAGEVPGSDRWSPVLVRPGKDLGAELDRAGLPGHLPDAVAARLAVEPAVTRLLLIVDQFEELLTQPASAATVLTQLAAAVGTPGLSVVLLLRDDFYPELAAMAPDLLQALLPGLLNVPATVDVRDLREIVIRPAEAAGLRCEDGLADRIISELLDAEPESAQRRRAPITVLPLLELTLSQLWQRRRDGQLTHDAYQRVGGVAGAVATWCDTAVEQLPSAQRPTARRILTGLVRPADEMRRVPAVRQQVPVVDLRDQFEDDTVDEVLAVLIDHRIVTTRSAAGVPMAELVHEALIREWVALREWVEQDHRFQDWLRRAGERQANWARRHDPDDLLHGTDLAEGLDWLRQRRLPRHLAEFLAASQHAQRAAIRRARRLNSILAGLLAVAVAAAGTALWQRQTAVDAQRTALSRQLAAQSAALFNVDPDQASALAVRAYRASGTAEATGALYAAAESPLLTRLTDSALGGSPLAFSPDGRTLATVSDRQAVRLWDVPSGESRVVLPEQASPAWSLAFSPDGRTLATTGEDGTAQLWDVAARRIRATVKGKNAVQFSPDGRTVVTAGDEGARVWNAADGRAGPVLDGHAAAVNCVSFAPDGRTIVTGGTDGIVRLWNPPRSRILDGAAYCGTFAPDGRVVATTDGTAVRLRNLRSGRVQATIPGAVALDYSRDGRTLALLDLDGRVRLWDNATRRTRLTLPGTGVVTFALSPDGRMLATATAARAGSLHSVVRLWDATAGSPRTTLTGHTAGVNAVAFSPDGRTLLTGGDDRTARLWDVTGGHGEVLVRDPNGVINAVAVSPDGRTLATGGDGRSVTLWDTATRTQRASLSTDALNALDFSPDGSIVAGAGARTAQVWDTATGSPGATLVGHTGWVTDVDFSPDGNSLATASEDDTVALWNTSATIERPRHVFPGPSDVHAVTFSPDGRLLAAANSDNTVRLWHTATRHPQSTLYGHTGAVRAVAFSPDGGILATAGDDDTARLWDVVTGQPRATLTGHAGDVTAIAISPDGRTLATASTDGVVRLWPVSSLTPRSAIERLCRAMSDVCPR